MALVHARAYLFDILKSALVSYIYIANCFMLIIAIATTYCADVKQTAVAASKVIICNNIDMT